jgi:hypothetical protein
MEHPVRDFHDELKRRNAKSPALAKAGLCVYDLRRGPGSAASAGQRTRRIAEALAAP